DTATAFALILLPWGANKASRLLIGKLSLQVVFELFEARADTVAQFFKPALGGLLFLFDILRDDCRNFVALHLGILSRNVPSDLKGRKNSNVYLPDLAKSCSLAKREECAACGCEFLSPRKDSS